MPQTLELDKIESDRHPHAVYDCSFIVEPLTILSQHDLKISPRQREKAIPIITPQHFQEAFGSEKAELATRATEILTDYLHKYAITDGVEEHLKRRQLRKNMESQYGELIIRKIYQEPNQLRLNNLFLVKSYVGILQGLAKLNHNFFLVEPLQEIEGRLAYKLHGFSIEDARKRRFQEAIRIAENAVDGELDKGTNADHPKVQRYKQILAQAQLTFSQEFPGEQDCKQYRCMNLAEKIETVHFFIDRIVDVLWLISGDKAQTEKILVT